MGDRSVRRPDYAGALELEQLSGAECSRHRLQHRNPAASPKCPFKPMNVKDIIFPTEYGFEPGPASDKIVSVDIRQMHIQRFGIAVRWGSQRPGEHRQFFPALHFICLGCCHSGHCRSIQSSKQKSCRAQMLRAQPPLHRTGADFHRSADTGSDTVEKRKAEGLYLFGMWAPALRLPGLSVSMVELPIKRDAVLGILSVRDRKSTRLNSSH